MGRKSKEQDNVHSANLEFTIVIHHEPSKVTENQLRSSVCQCFGPVLQWISQPRLQVPGQKLNLKEPPLKIHCRTHVVQQKHHHYGHTETRAFHLYKNKIREWLSLMSFYPHANQRPWLEIDSNEAFPKVRAASHENVPVFLCSFGSLVWNSEFVETCGLPKELHASFYHDIRCVEITAQKTWQVRLRYSNVRQLIVHEERGSVDLIFLLAHPPSIYLKTTDKGATFRGRQRVDKIDGVAANTFGRSNAIRLKLPNCLSTYEIVSRLFFRCDKKPVAYTVMSFPMTSNTLNLGLPEVNLADFRCTYMLTGLFWRTLSVQLQQWEDFLRTSLEHAISQPNVLFQALNDLISLCDEGAIIDYHSSLKQLIQFYSSKAEDLNLRDKAYIRPDNTTQVWRATITPTRRLLWPPALLFENRILRNFDADYALRVVFRDDDDCKLNILAGSAHPDFYNFAIVAPVWEGIVIGDRRFEFLGWSNSQIREHGAWTYAKDQKGVTASKIREWMGDFSHIQSVPKFMARMGQCFSHTKKGVGVSLDRNQVLFEPDIMGGTNPENGKPYCFTDGVGKISPQLLKEVCIALRYEGEVIPSAIQFRYGGCKGMLVCDPTLKDVDIVIRDSQNKFPCSGSQELEVCKVSSPVAVNLNRQLISILDHHGIDKGVFLKLQEKMLESATVILLEPEQAVEYLNSHCALTKLNYRGLYNVGVEINSEPFFRTLLLALHWKVVFGIMNKARLEIPPDFGRNMFGVVDETGKLEYGQVFVKYSTDVTKQLTTSQTKVLEGKVVITKNPCLQPGDVRVLEAVDIPELHHIVDCVVFPQKGPRPHPSEMAGSDLDGDEYTVIWYEHLIFQCDNEPASHFPIPEEHIKEGTIEVKDMLDFLAKYIRNDQVGVIGHAHLAKSDTLGLNSKVSKSIARKFSIAVDFVKNGQLVTLDKDEKVYKYPDFMNKEGVKPTYRSKRALGKLYRICKDFQEDGDYQELAYRNVKVDPDLVYPGWEQFEASAKKMQRRYNRLLDLLLSSNGLCHEAEAIAQANVKLQEQRDRADVEEIVLESLRTIWSKMQREFNHDLKDITSVQELAEKTLQKASAWYFVTYADPKPVHLSFAWIMSSELQKIKSFNCQRRNSPLQGPRINSFKFMLERNIYQCIEENQVPDLPKDLQDRWSSETSVAVFGLRLIFHWARHHRLLNEDIDSDCQKILKTLSKKENLLWSTAQVADTYFFIMKQLNASSIVDILIGYLQALIGLHFRVTTEGGSCNPNELKKVKFIGRKAMYTYHCLAISANLTVLGLNLTNDSQVNEEQELGPICLSLELVKKYKEDSFNILKSHLLELSEAVEINVRRQDSRYLLSAIGSSSSLKAIRHAISKGHDTLLDL